MNYINKWTHIPNEAKSSIAFAASSFIINGISFLVTPVFTRIIPQNEFGLVTTYNSWVAILSVFALLGLTSAGVFNVGLKDHKEDRDQFISSVLVLSNCITIVLFLILFILKHIYGAQFILRRSLMLAMCLNFIFSPAQVFWITKQRYEFKYRLAFLLSIFSAFFSQLVSALAVIYFSSTSAPLHEVKIWGALCGNMLFQIPIYIVLLLKGRRFFDLAIWKSTLAYALPLLPHYLAQHIMNSSDRIMIESLSSASGVAIYGVVSSISSISLIIWNAINASLVPYTFQKIENSKDISISRVVVPILIIYGLMCVFVTLIAPEMLQILAPKDYYEGIYAIPPIAATAFTGALYNIYANIEFYYKKSWWITFSTVVASSLNIILNYILIPRYGYIAAAYTTLISHILLAVMHYLGFKRCGMVSLYSNMSIFIISSIVICTCVLTQLLYAVPIIRYGFLILFVLICIIQKDRIVSIIKNIRN